MGKRSNKREECPCTRKVKVNFDDVNNSKFWTEIDEWLPCKILRNNGRRTLHERV